MQFSWALHRLLLSPAVIVILFASMPKALAGDEIIGKPASLQAGTKNFIFTPEKLGLAKSALSQRKFLGMSGIALFQVAAKGNGLTLNGLGLPLILARGDGSAINGTFAPKSGGNAHASSSSVARISGGTKPALSPGQARGKTDDGLLTVDPATINFGSVPVGSYENQMGTLIASDSQVTVSSATISSPEFTLTGLSFPFTIPAGGRQDYTVTFAPPAAGNASATLTFANDGNSLATQNLIGIGGDQPAHIVDLSWNASTSPDVVGYNIYRGATSGGPYSRINSALNLSMVYTDAYVLNGNTYYYVTTSVDSSGQESVYSNEVQAVIP
jgi:hypothetical protein